MRLNETVHSFWRIIVILLTNTVTCLIAIRVLLEWAFWGRICRVGREEEGGMSELCKNVEGCYEGL